MCCYPGFSCTESSACSPSCSSGGVDRTEPQRSCLRPVRNPSRTTPYILLGVVHRSVCCDARVVMLFAGYDTPSEDELLYRGRIYLGGLSAGRTLGDAPPFNGFGGFVAERIVSDCNTTGAYIYWTALWGGIRLFTYRAPVITQSTADGACKELYHADIDMNTGFGRTGQRCVAEGIPTGIGGWSLFSDHSDEPPALPPPSPGVRIVGFFPTAFSNAGDRTFTRGGETYLFNFPTVNFDYQLTDIGSPLP